MNSEDANSAMAEFVKAVRLEHRREFAEEIIADWFFVTTHTDGIHLLDHHAINLRVLAEKDS